MTNIAVIPGDGIGKEVVAEGCKLLDALGIGYRIFNYDADYWLTHQRGISDEQLEELRAYDAIYFGALGDARIPKMEHGKEILLKLRFGLDLFANIRPIRLLDVEHSPLKSELAKQIDTVIVRENTEDLYRGMGGRFKAGTGDEVAIDERIHTFAGVSRIINYAFEYATRARRRKVTLVDKHNAIPNGGQLWLSVFNQVAKDYPDIAAEYQHVDIAAEIMVSKPGHFDVIVTSNLFGDILSDLGAGLVGGMGLLPSANIGAQGAALFEPIHGSAPDIVGKGIANPIAAFATLSMLLQHVGRQREAHQLDLAIRKSVEEGVTTPDLGGRHSTREVGDCVIRTTLSSL
jgi:3-isopropylmalate dehydrogenase